MDDMYYIGLDVHKKTISYCVKDAAGHVHREGKIGSTRRELDAWIMTLPQLRMIAMEATILTGWIYHRLLPHAEKVKVAQRLCCLHCCSDCYPEERTSSRVGFTPTVDQRLSWRTAIAGSPECYCRLRGRKQVGTG